MRQIFNGFVVFIGFIVFFVFTGLVNRLEVDGGLDYRYRLHSVKRFFTTLDICLDPPIVVPYVNKSLHDFIRRDRVAILYRLS